MKQYQLEQVKFPKINSSSSNQLQIQPKKNKSNGSSQMLRIIISLLIAIFIYSQSQQTTINYNEIIKNQKMFLVKNIRGVLPTLSGSIYNLQKKWQILHFQNFHQNDSQIFNNYTLTFHQYKLTVQNIYCNFNLQYQWRNYSYNIDLKTIQAPTTSQVNSNNEAQFQAKETISPDPLIQNDHDPSALQNSNTQNKKVLGIADSKQKLQVCQKNKTKFIQLMKFTSVWTISDKNLYLLLENAHLEQDYYFILQPANR